MNLLLAKILDNSANLKVLILIIMYLLIFILAYNFRNSKTISLLLILIVVVLRYLTHHIAKMHRVYILYLSFKLIILMRCNIILGHCFSFFSILMVGVKILILNQVRSKNIYIPFSIILLIESIYVRIYYIVVVVFLFGKIIHFLQYLLYLFINLRIYIRL